MLTKLTVLMLLSAGLTMGVLSTPASAVKTDNCCACCPVGCECCADGCICCPEAKVTAEKADGCCATGCCSDENKCSK